MAGRTEQPPAPVRRSTRRGGRRQASLVTGKRKGKASEKEDSSSSENGEVNCNRRAPASAEKRVRQQPARKARKGLYSSEEEGSSDIETEAGRRRKAMREFQQRKVGSGSQVGSKSRIRNRESFNRADSEEEGDKPAEDITVVDDQTPAAEAEISYSENDEDNEISFDCLALPGPSFPRKPVREDMRTTSSRRIIESSSEEEDEKEDSRDSQDSYSDGEDEEFETESDEESEEGGEQQSEWRQMMDNLKRRGERYEELNMQYEEVASSRQLGGYDLSDDESRENKYPVRLLDNLRAAVVQVEKEEQLNMEEEKTNNDKLIKRWTMYEMREDKSKEGVCVCGKTGLRYMFFMRLVDCDGWQFHIKTVGSECINWFARANHHSVLAVFSRLVKEGCPASYRRRMDTGRLVFTLGGNALPQFLADHQAYHATEYNLPLTVEPATSQVKVKVQMTVTVPGGKTRRVKDVAGKPLKRDGRYQLFVKPDVKPCKDKTKVPVVDFVLLKLQDLTERPVVDKKTKTGKDFLK